jgi:hypothetical protein
MRHTALIRARTSDAESATSSDVIVDFAVLIAIADSFRRVPAKVCGQGAPAVVRLPSGSLVIRADDDRAWHVVRKDDDARRLAQ